MKSLKNNTQYLSTKELAKRFGVTVSTIYRLAEQHKLPGFKVGGQWRFSDQLLNAWVLDQVTVERLKDESP